VPPVVQPQLALTPGQAGIPTYSGDSILPLTRLEAKTHYHLLTPKPFPKKGELLSEEDLIRIYLKLPHEGDDPINDDNRAMSN
jgi:hypothetical protein